MMEGEITFANREQAGKRLADLLLHHASDNPIVLGLPRGGVVVAFQVAEALNAPLDVVVARKLGAPFQPEYGVGAIGPNGVRVLDESLLVRLGIAEHDMERIIARETEEMDRRVREYRGGSTQYDLEGKTAIVVDDGLATGVTALAACRGVRSQNPARLVLAVPVGAPQTVQMFRNEVDEVVCPLQPEDLRAVGMWYEDFSQTTDEEVMELLRRAREGNHAGSRP